MFKKTLSLKLLRMLDEKNLTVTSVAELANISRVYASNIINGKQTPSLDVFENLCAALGAEPNDLLLSEKSKSRERAEPAEVRQIISDEDEKNSFPLCPACTKPLSREYQYCCDNCGQKLSWKNYVNAHVKYEKEVVVNGKSDKSNKVN